MKNWQTLKLGSFLKRQYDSVQIDSFVKYKRITIKSKGQGIDIRDEVEGIEIGTKNQFKVKTNQFLLSKIDAMNGAFGIVPEQCNEGIITGNFWVYDIDENFILRDYLRLLSIQQVFTKFSIAASEGTTNRKYLREAKFLELNIDIPQIDEQKTIIQKIKIASTKLNEINSLRDVQESEMKNLRYSLMCNLENEFPKQRIDVVCDLKKGAFPIMKTDAGEYPFVVTAAEFKTADDFDFDCEATCVPLVSSTGHGNAAMHRVHYASGKFALSNLLCAVMPKDKEIVNAKFLYELFMAKKDEYFVPIMAGTSNVSLNPGKLGAVEIPIPPIEEQNRIVELLEKINEIKQTHKEQEAELKQLMPSLLDKAFKGELFSENSIQIQNGISLPTQQKEIKLPLAASNKNEDLEIAMIVALIESRLGNSYGEVGIQKTVFNIGAFNTALSRKYNFVNYHYGTYSAELKDSIKANSFLGKKVIKGNEVFTVSPSYKKEVLNAVTDTTNQNFVMAVNNVLDLYSSPFIGKHTDKIELLNTVTKLIMDLQTSDVNTIYEGMKKWTIKQQGFKNKADKFNITDTKKTIELLKSNDLIENLVRQDIQMNIVS